MALTEKKAFAPRKTKGKDNKEAAILAGCPEKTASAAGARLAKDPDVIAYLERLDKATPEQVVKHDVKPLTTNTTIQAAKNLADPLAFFRVRLQRPCRRHGIAGSCSTGRPPIRPRQSG